MDFASEFYSSKPREFWKMGQKGKLFHMSLAINLPNLVICKYPFCISKLEHLKRIGKQLEISKRIKWVRPTLAVLPGYVPSPAQVFCSDRSSPKLTTHMSMPIPHAKAL
jgi:hypothetical protein